MADGSLVTSQIAIKVGGNAVQQELLTKLAQVVVDQHTHLPGMFSIRLYDPDLTLLDNGPFDLTKEVEIGAETATGAKVTLIKGEITALEPEFKEGMNAELVVRGFDKSHRLYRESKSKTYLNSKDSDLAQELAGAVGLQAVTDTTNAVYEHLYQHNQSNLAFLAQRAWRIGYECFVDEGKLYFRKPPENGESVSLTWGQDLLSFTPRMSLAEQVDEVVVKGWDVAKKEAIVGKAEKGKLYPKPDAEGKDGAAWAQPFGPGKVVIVDQPVISQEEANTLATARLNEISGAFVEATGVAFRRPDIRAGKMVKLAALGKRFSGAYLVTSATHIYSAEGLSTHFTVSGTRTGLLTEQMRRQPPLERWLGVVPATVTNTDDPKQWGRVKVKFPWLSEEDESDWARVMGIGAGPEAGFCVMPAIEDEVLVAFVHGDFSRPIVLGGVWNGKHPLPPAVDGAAQGEKPLVRTWRSRSGHQLTFYDDADNKVELGTKGGQTLVLDDAGRKITIKSRDGLEITLNANNNSIEIKASGNLKIEAGGNLDITASDQITIKGKQINLN